MSFHDVRFPTNLSLGSIGGPERMTEIVTLASGYEERNSPWAHSRRRYDAGLGLRTLADIEAVIAFFEARHGQLHSFRWKDWSDYRSGALTSTDQLLGTGDGTTTEFQLIKTYVSGAQSYARTISKPVPGSVSVAVDGDPSGEEVDYTVDYGSGRITFFAPPAAGEALTAGFEFDVPVRFDTDSIQISVAGFEAGEVPSVPVVEVRQ